MAALAASRSGRSGGQRLVGDEVHGQLDVPQVQGMLHLHAATDEIGAVCDGQGIQDEGHLTSAFSED